MINLLQWRLNPNNRRSEVQKQISGIFNVYSSSMKQCGYEWLRESHTHTHILVKATSMTFWIECSSANAKTFVLEWNLVFAMTKQCRIVITCCTNLNPFPTTCVLTNKIVISSSQTQMSKTVQPDGGHLNKAANENKRRMKDWSKLNK